MDAYESHCRAGSRWSGCGMMLCHDDLPRFSLSFTFSTMLDMMACALRYCRRGSCVEFSLLVMCL